MKTKLIEGPFGLKMLPIVAKNLERKIKTLPQECQQLRRKTIITSPEIGNRTDISLITSDGVDREKDVVLPDGIDISWYLTCPIVLWGHNHDIPAIGRCVDIYRSSNGWMAKTEYATTDRASEVWQLVKSGVLCAKSIGFIPTSVRPLSTKDYELRPDWAEGRQCIESSILCEYSVVNIPSNPTALVQTVGQDSLEQALSKLNVGTIVEKAFRKITTQRL